MCDRGFLSRPPSASEGAPAAGRPPADQPPPGGELRGAHVRRSRPGEALHHERPQQHYAVRKRTKTQKLVHPCVLQNTHHRSSGILGCFKVFLSENQDKRHAVFCFSITPTEMAPFTEQLLTNLFKALALPGSTENEYIMKGDLCSALFCSVRGFDSDFSLLAVIFRVLAAIMRSFSLLQESIIPYIPTLIVRLTHKLLLVSKVKTHLSGCACRHVS